jgi:hypothetical protein
MMITGEGEEYMKENQPEVSNQDEIMEVAPFNVNSLQEYLKDYKRELGKLNRLQDALDRVVGTHASKDTFNIQVNEIVPNKNQLKSVPFDTGYGPVVEMVPLDKNLAAAFKPTALEQIFGQAIDGFQVIEILSYLFRQQENLVNGYRAAFEASGLEY